jgi:hypothetical protein
VAQPATRPTPSWALDDEDPTALAHHDAHHGHEVLGQVAHGADDVPDGNA